MLRETQHGEGAEGTAQTAPATSTPGPSNRAMGALAASSNPFAREEDGGYEFSDDPLAADWTPDNSIRVKPGPVRATLIRPGPPRTKKGEWLEDALRGDPLLKELPNWAREKAIDGLKDIDETIAEQEWGVVETPVAPVAPQSPVA